MLLSFAPAGRAADTTIVINKSLGGVKFYAPPSAVRKRFGKPTNVFKRQVPASSQLGAIKYESWNYAKINLTVTLLAVAPSTTFKVGSFEWASRTFRTRNGLRVGSSLADARAKLVGESCKPADSPNTQCRIDGGRVGPTESREFTTTVAVTNGKVSRFFMAHLPTWNLQPPS